MILKAIDRLSDRQKEIIYRAVVLNQSEKELARELNISPLKGLTKLNNLDLRSNQITDFSPLEGLKISNLKK
nr:sigma factor-like helix-turn-helix DNA-binding protein [Oceanirhabdus seepicola]